ncbi:MAG TPA: hypothetical protein VNG90_04525 [Candidatus Acidoferrum sp.]|nr:hypothetical protein [Candidatus Acidoferrum sp.]
MIKHIKPQLTINNGVLFVALLITANWVWGTVVALQNNFLLQEQVDTLIQQNSYYALQNQTLQLQQNYYKTNEYVELAARTWLGKASPGEKVLILPPNTVSDTVPDSTKPTTTPLAKRSNFEQWMYFLFGKNQR